MVTLYHGYVSGSKWQGGSQEVICIVHRKRYILLICMQNYVESGMWRILWYDGHLLQLGPVWLPESITSQRKLSDHRLIKRALPLTAPLYLPSGIVRRHTKQHIYTYPSIQTTLFLFTYILTERGTERESLSCVRLGCRGCEWEKENSAGSQPVVLWLCVLVPLYMRVKGTEEKEGWK